MRTLIGAVVIVFDGLLVKGWADARAAAAHSHHTAPSPVVYGLILAVSLIVLIALLRGGQSSGKPASRKPAQRQSGYPYTGSRG